MAIYSVNVLNEMHNDNRVYSFSEIFESCIIETYDVVRELRCDDIIMQEADNQTGKRSIIQRIIGALKKIKDIFIRTITRIKNAISEKLRKITASNIKKALSRMKVDPGEVEYYDVDDDKLYGDIQRCVTFRDTDATIVLASNIDKLNKIRENFVKDYTTRKKASYSNVDELCDISDNVIAIYSRITTKLNKIIQYSTKRINEMTAYIQKLESQEEIDDDKISRINDTLDVLNAAIKTISGVNSQIMDLNNDVISILEDIINQ